MYGHETRYSKKITPNGLSRDLHKIKKDEF